jgi:hypothetical protein
VETKAESDNRQRLRELAAKIATEQDHDRFLALVKEMSRFLDEELLPAHNAARNTDA